MRIDNNEHRQRWGRCGWRYSIALTICKGNTANGGALSLTAGKSTGGVGGALTVAAGKGDEKEMLRKASL